MPLVLPCSNCNQKIGIPEELKGKQIRCPKCRECFVVERRKPEQPQASAVAAAPAAQAPANQPTAAISKPAVFQCPTCSQKMRVPTEAGAAKFKCPGCATVFNFAQREGGSSGATAAPRPVTQAPVTPRPAPSRPAAPRPASPRPASPRPASPRPVARRAASSNRAGSATSGVARGFQAGPASGDSLFSDLPLSGPTGAAPAFTGASALSPSAPRKSFGGGGAAGRRIDTSKLGPSLLIGISYFLALLVGLFLLITVLRNDAGRSSGRDTTVLVVLFGLATGHFVAMIAGAVGMLMHAPRWLSITTCVAGMLPTIFASTLCFGVLLYPFALAGCIWGLVSLLGGTRPRVGYAGAGTQASGSFGGAAAASNDYMRQASREVAGKAASDESALSTGKAILCIVGGIGCLGFAAFAAYSYYQYMNGEAEVRRPGRAISGAVIAGITGISLLTQGIAGLKKRSG